MIVEAYNEFGIALSRSGFTSYKILPFTNKKLFTEYATLMHEDVLRLSDRKYVLVANCSTTLKTAQEKDKYTLSFDLNIAYADTKEELAIYADLHGLSPLEEEE